MKYIISSVIIFLSLLIIYVLNYKLEYKEPKNIEKSADKINILSDCIVILSKESCPFCIQLKDKIKNTNKKYTTITLNNMNGYDFDDTFTNLGVEERDNILFELDKVIKPGNPIYFPTVIVKDKIHFGLPKEEILSSIFDI